MPGIQNIDSNQLIYSILFHWNIPIGLVVIHFGMEIDS